MLMSTPKFFQMPNPISYQLCDFAQTAWSFLVCFLIWEMEMQQL